MKPLIWVQRHVGNRIVAAILRSPAHSVLSGRTMLLTVVGRRTGRRYTIPLGYVQQGGTLEVLVAGKHLKTWWHNLVGGALVELLLQGRILAGGAELLTFELDPRRFTLALRKYAAHDPSEARAVGIRDVEDLAGLRAAAAAVAMVLIRPRAAGSCPAIASAGHAGCSPPAGVNR